MFCACFVHVNFFVMITTRIYLDARQSKAGRPAPLKVAISLNGAVSYLPIGVKVQPSRWDSKAKAAKDPSTQLTISRVKLKIDTLLSDLQESGKLDGLNATEIRDLIARLMSPEPARKKLFLSWLEEFGLSRNKPRTREIYQCTVDRIRAFAPDADALSFEDITFSWLCRFDKFLARTAPKRNSRNIHFRNIKASFKYAIKNGVTKWYPFFEFEIHPEPTRKRNLSIDQLRKLFNAEVEPWKQKYIDFFKMSFMLIAINTEDLVHVKEVTGNRLEYVRAKTNKPYSVKVEPECMALIEKYRGEKYLLNILDTYANTHNWTSRVNNALHEICSDIGLPKDVSMYWARHSWSTLAINDLDIPERTVSAALGHSSKSVTDVYVNFDRRKIDKANRKMLDYVLYGKKQGDVYELIRQLNEKVERMTN